MDNLRIKNSHRELFEEVNQLILGVLIDLLVLGTIGDPIQENVVEFLYCLGYFLDVAVVHLVANLPTARLHTPEEVLSNLLPQMAIGADEFQFELLSLRIDVPRLMVTIRSAGI